MIVWCIAQFHVKLADALRAVQNSEVGEDPSKAEGAMSMLDEFQQSIGEISLLIIIDERIIRIKIHVRRTVRRGRVGSAAFAGPAGPSAARRRRPGTSGLRPPTGKATRPVLPQKSARRPGPAPTRLEHGAAQTSSHH